MSTGPHSTPVDAFPDWRVIELRHKYSDPHEWDAELDSDGEIDDVELEESSEESL
jgi:hypothetical protein